MKKQTSILSKLAILIIFIMICGNTMAQKSYRPSFKLELRIDVQVSPTEYEFDIYLTHIGSSITPADFKLSTVQCGIFVNDLIRNGGTLSASVVPGSSDLNMGQRQAQANMHITNSSPNQTIKITAKTASADLGSIVSKTGGTRVMRVKLSNTVCFGQAKPNLSWSFNFAGRSWPTKVGAYVNEKSKDISANGTYLTSGLTNPTLTSSSTPLVTLTPSVNPVPSGSPVTINAALQAGYTMSTSTWYVNDMAVANNSLNYTYTPGNNDHVYVSVQFNEACASPASSTALALNLAAGTQTLNNNTSISAYATEKNVFINNPSLMNISEVVIYNALGQVVTSFKPEITTLKSYNINAAPGGYIVKMFTEKNVISEKVTLK